MSLHRILGPVAIAAAFTFPGQAWTIGIPRDAQLSQLTRLLVIEVKIEKNCAMAALRSRERFYEQLIESASKIAEGGPNSDVVKNQRNQLVAIRKQIKELRHKLRHKVERELHDGAKP
jgi:hypothetical protein